MFHHQIARDLVDPFSAGKHQRPPVIRIQELGEPFRRKEIRKCPDLLQLGELLILILVEFVLRKDWVKQHVRGEIHDCI